MTLISDKGSMGADQVLKASYAAPAEVEVQESVTFEPFGLLGRRLSPGQKVKKWIFLLSAAAAVGYYVFLGILFLLR